MESFAKGKQKEKRRACIVMGLSEYEYRGLMAQTWDLLRGDPSGQDDDGFYREMILTYGEPVLDVGCGTGRLLLAYLADGIDIEGVDISPEMLAHCREKAGTMGLKPSLFEQSIVTLSLPRRYRTILAPSSVLQLVVEPLEAQRAIARLYDHLEPGGALISPFMTLWKEGMPLVTEWEKVAVRDEDGALLRRMGRVWYEPKDECEHTEDLYQVFVADQLVATEHHRRSPAARSYTQHQAHALFEQAGFSEIRLLHRLRHEVALPEDTLFAVVGIKAS
jgi:ubiquinone/menaquinone biosynthesis C-methylase UbiE